MSDFLPAVPPLPADAVFEDGQPTPDELLAELVAVDDTAPADGVGRYVAQEQRASGKFAIGDKRMAEWAMRRLAEASIRLDEDQRLYDEFRSRIDDWFRRVSAPHLATIGFFTDHLEDYGRRWIDTQPPSRPKSLPLPSGVVRTTTSQAAAEMVDDAAVLAWAKESHPEIVKKETREWVTVTDVRPLVEIRVDVDPENEELITKTVVVDKKTGEVVPGLGVKAKHTTVKIVPEQP